MKTLTGGELSSEMMRYARMSEEFERAGGYRSEATGVLKGSDFPKKNFQKMLPCSPAVRKPASSWAGFAHNAGIGISMTGETTSVILRSGIGNIPAELPGSSPGRFA